MKLSYYVTISLAVAVTIVPRTGSANPVTTPITQCASAEEEQRLSNTTASIGFMANFRRSSNSISVVAGRLMEQAMTKSTELACPDGCERAGSHVIYRVAPTAFQSRSKQRSECLQLDRQTAEEPFQFGELKFATLDELNNWITGFSRGNGVEGKKLYRQCGSNCSPRYTFRIQTSQTGSYALTAEVHCSLARDRSSNRYALSTALSLDCNATSSN